MSEDDRIIEQLHKEMGQAFFTIDQLMAKVDGLEKQVKELQAAEERRSEWEDEQIERMD